MANYCPNCGQPVDSSAAYCSSCGASITGGGNNYNNNAYNNAYNNTTAQTSNFGNTASSILGTLVTVSLLGGLTRQLYYYSGRYFLDPYCMHPYMSPHLILHRRPFIGGPMGGHMGHIGGPGHMGGHMGGPMGGPRGGMGGHMGGPGGGHGGPGGGPGGRR